VKGAFAAHLQMEEREAGGDVGVSLKGNKYYCCCSPIRSLIPPRQAAQRSRSERSRSERSGSERKGVPELPYEMEDETEDYYDEGGLHDEDVQVPWEESLNSLSRAVTSTKLDDQCI